ncbi:MAG: class I SAM-dependent methyltransferase [Pyrinomonadaceae bacterium]
MSKKAFDDFDGFASDYRQIHNETIKFSGADSDFFSEQKVEEIRKVENRDNLNILDLGCGDGNSAVFFQKYFPHSTYLGLDVSRESIAVAKEKTLQNAEFAHYNGFDLPSEESSLDLVFIACVLHHINFDNHEKVLGEVKRVLKPNGRLYIFEHNPFNPVTRKVVSDCPFDEDAVLLSPSYTKKILTKLDFRQISTNYTIFFPRVKALNWALPLENYLKWMPFGGQYYTKANK